MFGEISIGQVSREEHLSQILQLQQENLESVLNPDTINKEGFVTVQHDLPTLRILNDPIPHVVALDKNHVVGYALVMDPEHVIKVPRLQSLIDQLALIFVDGVPITHLSYVIMGQICVAKTYRGQGIVQGMYHKMAEVLATRYEWLVTSISTRNTRSFAAHHKSGFQVLGRFVDEVEETWDVVGLRIG